MAHEGMKCVMFPSQVERPLRAACRCNVLWCFVQVTLTALRMLGTMASFSSSIVQHDLTAIVTFLHNLCPYVEYHLSRLIHKQNKYVSRAVAIPSSPGSAASKSAAAAKSGADSAKGAAVLTAQAKRSSGTAARKAKAGSSLLGQQHTGRLGGKAEAVPGFTREALRDMRRSSALVTAGLWCVYEWVSHCPWLIALDTAPILSATDKSHARAASLDFAALERTDSYTAANMAAAANTSAAGAKRASMAKDAPLMHHVLRLAVMGLSSQTNAYSAWDVHNASLVLLRLMVSDLGRYTYIDRGLNLAGGPPPCSPQTAELSALLEWCSARKLPLGTGLGRKLAQLRGNVRLSSSLTEWDIVYWMSLQGHLTLPAGTNIGRLTAMSHHGGRAGGTGWDSALAYALHKNVRFFLLNSRALVSVIECDAHQGPPADDSKEGGECVVCRLFAHMRSLVAAEFTDERKSIPLAPGARDEAGVRDSVTAHGHVLQPPYTIVVLRCALVVLLLPIRCSLGVAQELERALCVASGRFDICQTRRRAFRRQRRRRKQRGRTRLDYPGEDRQGDGVGVHRHQVAQPKRAARTPTRERSH